MSKQTAGMASCDIENEGENIVGNLFYRLCYCNKEGTYTYVVFFSAFQVVLASRQYV
jgi:hypothetical protein